MKYLTTKPLHGVIKVYTMFQKSHRYFRTKLTLQQRIVTYLINTRQQISKNDTCKLFFPSKIAFLEVHTMLPKKVGPN